MLDSFYCLLLTIHNDYAILKTSDREVPYQALLFKKISWNYANGGGRYGILPVQCMRSVSSYA